MKYKTHNDMKEIYWIQRLDSLCDLCEAVLVLSIIAAIVAVITFLCSKIIDDFNDVTRVSKKVLIISIISAVAFGLANAFIPTSKELLVIYGVGGTIDYVQDNEKLQQLPDKVVEALTMWMDTLTEEDKR